jgi:beta-glucosidase
LGNAYRFSVDWARLQPSANAPFDEAVVKEYLDFINALRARNVRLLLVLHHFATPLWFNLMGGECEHGARAIVDRCCMQDG